MTKTRTVGTEDLIRLRDVGLPSVSDYAGTPFALSPDGHEIAFVLTQGDPVTNVVCSALVVVPLAGGEQGHVLDYTAAAPRARGTYRNLLISTGFPQLLTPAWSPDGRFLAWRKRIGGLVQVVIVQRDGGSPRVATHSPADVEAFSWSADGSELHYSSRASLPGKEDAIDREGLKGWFYDRRVIPNMSWRPRPWADATPIETFAVDVATGKTRPAAISRTGAGEVPAVRIGAVDLPSGARVWSEPVNLHPESEDRLVFGGPDGAQRPCLLSSCTGHITAVFPGPDGRSVFFINRIGWNAELTGLYRWWPGSHRLLSILKTRDALTGCVQSTTWEIICGRENATHPRYITAISLHTGQDRLVFDPNPEFTRLRLGKVQRLYWRNHLGLPVWGDLVLPPDLREGNRVPLIVVLYNSRGFLRGGTGDEFPIFPFASKGMAVLSIQRPPEASSLNPDLRNWDEVRAAAKQDWAERRNMHSAVMGGIEQALATGAVDPAQIGITGLSDGASTVEYALINSDRFAAAAIGTCCDDWLTSLVLGGFAWGDQNRRYGQPPSVDVDLEFWAPLSLSVNARRIKTPILMQVADREALLALQSFGALREAGRPVEMYVFPDEYHNKWQPAHKLAVYERNLDWFRFWLLDEEDTGPDKAEEYARWSRLRSGQESSVTAQ